MLMSQAASSAAVRGWPRFGPAAPAAFAARASRSATHESLGVDMLHLALRIDRPAGDGIEMLVGEAQHGRRLLRLAADCDKLGSRRLHIAGLVPGATLQHRRAAVPAPQRAKARERLAVNRFLQCSLRP